jgi:hypothetical protein
MYENINPDAIDTTNLYKFLKDAIHQMVAQGYDEAKIAATLDDVLNKHFTIAKKSTPNLNEKNKFGNTGIIPPYIKNKIENDSNINENYHPNDYIEFADDVEPFLNKEQAYSYNDFVKAFVKTGIALQHSKDMNAIINILKQRGYQVEPYLGEGDALSTINKKGTNAKPNGPAHTILSQEGDGISKVIEKGINIKPTLKKKSLTNNEEGQERVALVFTRPMNPRMMQEFYDLSNHPEFVQYTPEEKSFFEKVLEVLLRNREFRSNYPGEFSLESFRNLMKEKTNTDIFKVLKNYVSVEPRKIANAVFTKLMGR